MNKKELHRLIKTQPYSFLEEKFNDRLVFLVVCGSHAYGLETEESDVDVRGVALPTAEDILLGRDFKTYTDKKTDTVVYSLAHFCELAKKGSPVVFEMLGVPDYEKIVIDEGVYRGLRELLPEMVTERAALQFLNKSVGMAQQAVASGVLGKNFSNAYATLQYLDQILMWNTFDPKIFPSARDRIFEFKVSPFIYNEEDLKKFNHKVDCTKIILEWAKENGEKSGLHKEEKIQEKLDDFLIRENMKVIVRYWARKHGFLDNF